MNYLLRVSVFFAVLMSHTSYGLGPLLTLFDTKKWDAEQIFVKAVEKSIADLTKREEEAQKAQEQYKASLDTAQNDGAKFKEERQRVRGVELEYTNKQIDIVNSTVQVLTELIGAYQRIQDMVDEHIKVLQEYKEDPEFEKKGYQLEEKSIYSIEDFQKVNGAVLRHETTLKTLQEQLDKIGADSERLKKSFALAKQDLVDKKKEQAELKERRPEDPLDRKQFTLKQQGALLDSEERLLSYKRDLSEVRLLEADRKAEFFELSLKLTKLQLEMLQKQEDRVRRELRIDPKDIVAAERALGEQRQKYNRLQDEYGPRVTSLGVEKQKKLDKLKSIKELADISDVMLEEMLNWTYRPASIKGWNDLIDIGRLHDQVYYEIVTQKDFYLAKVEQARVLVDMREVEKKIIDTWHNLSTDSLEGMNGELAKEIKRYEKIQADLVSSIASLEDKRADASRLLLRNNQTSVVIKERFADLKNQQGTVFKTDQILYKQLDAVLKKAFVESQKRAEYIPRLIDLYSAIIQQQEMSIKKIGTMARVLQSKAQSRLVPPLWHGVKKFVPDMGKFVRFLATPGRFQASLGALRLSLSTWVGALRTNPGSLLLAILYLLAALVMYFFLRFYLLDIGLLITNLVPPEYGFVHMIAGFISMVIQFLGRFLNGIFIWSMLLIAVRAGVTDPYTSALFYLASIPLWLLYVNRFVSYAKAVNKARDYQFASSKYHNRFFFLVSSLLSSTAILMFLQEALGKVLPYSDAPTILQAINFIIFQVSLILMISREQLLRLIPRYASVGKWIQEFVDRYYYLFLLGLIVIIVMSNPYLGYGTHFLYLILRVALIMLLVPLLIALHGKIKSAFARLFFDYDDEGRLKESFPYARTSYGLLIIGSFIFFSLLAVIAAANIWGLQVGFNEIIFWLRKELWQYKSAETGMKVKVNFLHLLRVLFYGVIAVAVAFVINKFVLRRMFDLLMVNAGVQSIFLSLTRYIILIVAIIVGLQSIGLGSSLLLYLLAIFGGLGFAGKEIVSDILGYFMILIQRPLKIGDFIQLDPTIIGVVRHLNLRSVVIRKRNSVNIVIPNSYLLNRPFVNWNYYPMFYAFNDITISISYDADPEMVRDLFLKVLEDNYEVLRNPAPIVWLDDFTESGFQFVVRGYVSHDKVLEQYAIASTVRLQLVRALRENGLDVGSPVRNVNMVPERKSVAEEALADLMKKPEDPQ